jgi:hypothetical protein
MTLEELKRQQDDEIKDYWENRNESLLILYKDQKTIINNCDFNSPKAEELVKQILDEQHKLWEQVQKDNLDMLLHMHKLEIETLKENELKQKKFNELLSSTKGKEKDNGR